MNLDCNLQTIEAKRATAIDVDGNAKQTTRIKVVYLLKIVFQWVMHRYVHNVNTLNTS